MADPDLAAVDAAMARTAKDDGGPAFPSPTGNVSQRGQLSVRDYFAGQALKSLGHERAFLASCAAASIEGTTPEEQLSRRAYAIADAMLKERTR